MKLKSFFKKYPLITILGSIIIFCFIGYIALILIVLRPVNMANGRMESYDKSWKEIETNIDFIKIGTSLDSLNLALGRPDSKQRSGDSTIIYSFQQYGAIAPHWVYDIHVKEGFVIKIESYDW